MTPGPSINDAVDPRLVELYRQASPTQKLSVVLRLNSTLIGLKEAALRTRHPEATGEQRLQMLRHWWLTASD